MGSLVGKVAIITGAGRGQGSAVATRFVAEGAKVVVTDINEHNVLQLAERLGGDSLAMHHDVRDEAAWSRVVDTALRVFGAIDVLVNNAGVLMFGSVFQADRDSLERALQVNLVGAFLGIKAVCGPMQQPSGGSIVNIASGASMKGAPSLLAYVTSKWALRGMSRAAALDLAQYKIRVNTICPGVIDTPMTRQDAPAGFFERLATDIPLGRHGVPEDIAGVAAFLASDSSSFMTGSDLVADGGRLA